MEIQENFRGSNGGSRGFRKSQKCVRGVSMAPEGLRKAPGSLIGVSGVLKDIPGDLGGVLGGPRAFQGAYVGDQGSGSFLGASGDSLQERVLELQKIQGNI